MSNFNLHIDTKNITVSNTDVGKLQFGGRCSLKSCLRLQRQYYLFLRTYIV